MGPSGFAEIRRVSASQSVLIDTTPRKLPDVSPFSQSFCLDDLMKLIEGRKTNPKEGSYTTYLFEKGIDKILKKVGEECTEVIIAGKGGDRAEAIFEIADLTYHVMVMMTEMGISIDEVRAELASRHVVDKKIKQEKMK